MKRRIGLCLASVAFLAACGGGGGGGGADVSVPAATGENQSSGLIPNPNGFAFPNFGSAATPEVFNEADLVEMFGNTPEVCVDGAEPCVATAEAAGWARMVNESRAAGHCEGFAVLAAARFMAAEQPATVELVNQGDVTHALMRSFATQFFDETKKATKSIVKKSMRDKVAILEAGFAKKKVGDVVGVYSEMGGHALLPYAIEYVTPDVAKIMIYDSNWPGQERFITVDMAADTWTFPFSGPDPANDPSAWTGGTKDFDIAPYEARIAGTCPFCKGDSAARQTLLVIRSATADWTVETPDGTLSPTSTEAGDSTVRPMRSSVDMPDVSADLIAQMGYLVSLSLKEGEKVQLQSSTPALIATGITPAATFQIDSRKATQAVEIALDSLATNDPATVLTLAAGDRVASSNGLNNTLQVLGDTISAAVDGADGTPVAAVADDSTKAIDVRTPGREGVADDINYEIVAQKTAEEIEKTTVGLDGTQNVTAEGGRLANTQVYQEPPAELAVPAVKPGLPSAESRTIGEPAPTTTSATTIVGETTTTSTTTTIAGSTTSGVARPTTTAPRSATTTVAPTRTTTAQNANVRKNVVMTTNLDNWAPGLSDPISSGFSAKLSGGLGQLDGDPCADVACLESVQATILGGGTDSATGQDTVVPATFTMSGVSGPFAVRCGAGGNWVNASNNGGTYSASCSFANVTSDETVYLRA